MGNVDEPDGPRGSTDWPEGWDWAIDEPPECPVCGAEREGDAWGFGWEPGLVEGGDSMYAASRDGLQFHMVRRWRIITVVESIAGDVPMPDDPSEP